MDGHSDLLWRFWDGQYIVYHVDSGDTHVLDAVAGEALKAIEEQPGLMAEGVTQQVAAALELTVEPALGLRMVSLIRDLARRGLIESVTNP